MGNRYSSWHAPAIAAGTVLGRERELTQLAGLLRELMRSTGVDMLIEARRAWRDHPRCLRFVHASD